MKRMQGRGLQILLLLLCCYGMWVAACRQQIHDMPHVAREDLSAYVNLTEEDGLTEEDYEKIFQQTGLTRYGMDTLIRKQQTALLEEIQDRFFEEPQTETLRANVFCHQEWLAEPTEAQPHFVAEDGDIIITLASYLGGWRYGHCGLILDAEQGTVLEAITYGEPSCQMDIDHWEDYPAFVILRPDNASRETKQAVIDYAYEELQDIPYDLFSFKTRDAYGPITKTHCSHLIWYAYHSQGYDMDFDKTPVVTPYDLIHDDDLVLVQVYGMYLEGK